MAERQIIQHLRTNETNVKPSVSEIEYGEIAINYKKDEEKIFIKNDNNELVTFVSEKAVAKKQDVISDLATIRSNAAKGATALQSVPAEYVTEMELANKNYVTSAYVIGELSSKSDTGHTHSEYLTEHQDISGKADKSSLATVATSGSYNDLTDKPVIPSIDGLATVTYVNQEIGKIQNSSYDDTEIKNQLANKADKSELFSKSYNDLTDKPTIPSVDGLASEDFVREEIEAIDYVTAVDTVEEVDGVSNDFVTSEQLDGRDYATNSSVNSQIQEVNEVVNEHSSRMDRIENYVEPSVRSQILWLGTSIPSGDAVNQPNNNYPRMVAEAMGCTVFNNARAGSIVSWYPNAPAWTTSANVDAEFATGYCLSASKNELRTKYYNVLETIRQNEGLSTSWRDEWLEDFYDKSYENLIIPYIDGTIASCDTVVIDHGFNDRHNIFDVCRQHPHEEDNLSKWPPEQVGGADVTYPVNNGNDGWFWLTHLADNRYYDGEVYMNTLRALAAAGDGSMRGEYFGAMAFIIEIIRKINPRVRIIIGNYFSLDHGFDAMSSFQTKYILQANQSIADYYGFHIVNVYKRTGLRNYSFTDNSGVTTTDMIRFCPDGVHPASDTTGLSNKIIAGIYLNELKGSLYI